jgi:hypothetical protein
MEVRMEKKHLEEKGLNAEQIEFVLAENTKDTAKATKPLTDKIAAMEKQAGEYEEKLKGVEGLDEKAKADLDKIQKEHAAAIKKMKEDSEVEIGKMKREAETKEFFAGLGKKFVTPETAAAFEAKLNDALADKAYEGKNRKDIFDLLIKDADGKDRADIFAATTAPPTVTGGTNPPPGGNDTQIKAIPTII